MKNTDCILKTLTKKKGILNKKGNIEQYKNIKIT